MDSSNFDIWASVLSDLLINLSAGWFGAALVVPLVVKPPKKGDILILLMNLGAGILFLALAFEIRKLI